MRIMPRPVGLPRLTVRPLVSECSLIPLRLRPVSSATRPWPPSCAMVMALRESRQTLCGTITASAATIVAMTTQVSGSGWLPKTSSQREASEVAAMLSIVGLGSLGSYGIWQSGTYVRTVCSESWTRGSRRNL